MERREFIEVFVAVLQRGRFRLCAANRSATAYRSPWRGCDGLETVDGCLHRPPAGSGLDCGREYAIEYRWAEGRSRRVSEIAAEFLRQDVDVIVTYGSAVPILKQATTTIPIVFAVAFDPVRDGLVQSLAHPGGNVTGMSIRQLDLVGKRLELLREAIPQLHRLAILADAGYAEPMLEAEG